jgi:hypothetical protein
MKVLVNTILKELYPQHSEEIEKLSYSLACGCACCVLGVLRSKYDLDLSKIALYDLCA